MTAIVVQQDPWSFIRKALAQASEANVVVEVGAYNGDDTRSLHSAARKPVRQFAFEPDPRNLAKLYSAGLPDGVTLVPAAVGGVDGRARLYQSSGRRPEVPGDGEWDCSSSLRAPKDHLTCFPWITFDQSCEVEVVTLDAFLGARGLDGVDFLWADAQGAERDIVQGAARTLERSRFVYFEQSVHEFYAGQWRRDEMIDGMEAMGWPLLALFDCDALFYNRRVFPTAPF